MYIPLIFSIKEAHVRLPHNMPD